MPASARAPLKLQSAARLGDTSQAPGTAEVFGSAAAYLLAMGFIGSRARNQKTSSLSRTVCRARGGESVDDLRKEAAKLRDEVAEFEKECTSQREEERLKTFAAFDLSKTGTINVDELHKGLQTRGYDLDRTIAAKILAMVDTNKDGVIHVAKFNEHKIVNYMGQVKREAREAEFKQRQVDAAMRLVSQEHSATIAQKEHIDESLEARVLSVLPYLLPFMDVLRYMTGTAQFLMGAVPILGYFFAPLAGLGVIWNSMPLLQFGFFLALLFGSESDQFPLILRLNMRNAAMLSVTLGFCTTLWSFVSLVGFGTPMPFAEPAGSLIFFGVLASILYSVNLSLFGQLKY